MLLKSQNYLRGFCNQFKKLFWKLFKTISLENNSDYPLRLTKPSPNGDATSNKWRIFLCRISSITWRNIYKLYKWFARYFAKIKRCHILNDLWARATDNWKIILRLPWMLFSWIIWNIQNKKGLITQKAVPEKSSLFLSMFFSINIFQYINTFKIVHCVPLWFSIKKFFCLMTLQYFKSIPVEKTGHVLKHLTTICMIFEII